MLTEYKIFDSQAEVDTSLMDSIVRQMRETLRYFSEHPNGNEHLTPEILDHYVRSLVKCQVPWTLAKEAHWAWIVAPDSKMPSDARYDFVFLPTAIAVATLTLYRQRFPEKAEQIPDFDTVLKRGMIFSSLRTLQEQGHGYDATREMIEILQILALGNVYGYLNTKQDFCRHFYSLLRNTVQKTKKRLVTGKTAGLWNKNYRKDFESILRELGDDAP